MVTQSVKALATKHDDLNPNLGTHMVGGEQWLLRLSSATHMCHDMCASPTHAYVHKPKQVNVKNKLTKKDTIFGHISQNLTI